MNKNFKFKNVPIDFVKINEQTYVNATQMAKAYGTSPAQWLRLESAKKLIYAMQKTHSDKYQLVITNVGGDVLSQGTWLHKKIVIDFAAWLDIDFKIWIYDTIDSFERGESFTTDQISALLDLTKAMTLTSIRKESERKHFDFFNKPTEWWTYRAKLLGYSKETMQKEMAKINKIYKNNEQALSLLEPSELIRTGTIDLLIALGKSREYSLNVAKLTKRFAVEMGIDKEIWNDVKENPLKLNQKEVEEKKGFFSNVRKMLGV